MRRSSCDERTGLGCVDPDDQLSSQVRQAVMKRIRPLERASADAARLAGMVGASLSGVTYHYLPPADAATYTGWGAALDVDLSAVVLHFGDREERTVTWTMDGDLEGLALLEGPGAYEGLADRTVDASRRSGWTTHLGEAVVSLGAAWHVSASDCPPTLWALRHDFPTGSVVLALGALQATIDYAPDEVVVIFDADTARAYRPHHADGSSWGAALASDAAGGAA